ncbi:MAG: hypothetical protein HY023_04850 [Chloroflexi bacterium]|nr:hypothetical protein [Chloroflexota bacterium]MBI3764213.1 hypothetical protein [Chloroflexota bacterium]
MELFDTLLSQPIISRIRRNHGLEHATIHMLSARFRGTSLVGRSTPGGFYLYGEVTTEAVDEAAREALSRMKNGEHHLAIHPGCGTNFVTAGFFAAIAAFIALLGSGRGARSRLGRMPAVIIATTAALILAQPAGFALQQYTTSGEPGALEIKSVTLLSRKPVTTHRVDTRG